LPSADLFSIAWSSSPCWKAKAPQEHWGYEGVCSKQPQLGEGGNYLSQGRSCSCQVDPVWCWQRSCAGSKNHWRLVWQIGVVEAVVDFFVEFFPFDCWTSTDFGGHEPELGRVLPLLAISYLGSPKKERSGPY
jgi:hypothetical protein